MMTDQARFTLSYNELCKIARRHARDQDTEIWDAVRKAIRDLQTIARKRKLELPE